MDNTKYLQGYVLVDTPTQSWCWNKIEQSIVESLRISYKLDIYPPWCNSNCTSNGWPKIIRT